MSFAYEDFLHLNLPSDDSVSHGDELRENWKALSRINCADNMYFVSPAFTTAELYNSAATDRRHFNTIQGAIDAAEGTTYSHLPTIVVSPAVYAEALSITGSINIVGALPVNIEGLGGGRAATIKGDGGQEPVIVVDPTDGESCAVNFSNLYFYNTYSAATTAGVQISKPYLAELKEPTTYGPVRNGCFFNNCQMRMQTWGDNNDWINGISASGEWNLGLMGCGVGGYGYGGGEYNGGIQRLVSISCNALEDCSLYVRNSNFYNSYAGSSAAPVCIYAFGGVGGFCTRTSFGYTSNGARFSSGVSPDVDINGLSSAFTEHGNLDGITTIAL